MKRPQISIRTLLWLMLVLSAALSWLPDTRRLESRLKAAESLLFEERVRAEVQAITQSQTAVIVQELKRRQEKNLRATH
jgi:hypothetical protein